MITNAVHVSFRVRREPISGSFYLNIKPSIFKILQIRLQPQIIGIYSTATLNAQQI